MMKECMAKEICCCLLAVAVFLPGDALAQSPSELWVGGHAGDLEDVAWDIVRGTDGHLYVVGDIMHSATGFDIAVMSLDEVGAQRWLYTYNGWGTTHDIAFEIVDDPEGNLYVVGIGGSEQSIFNITVISLDASGAERWVYIYDGPASAEDSGLAIAYGPDGHLYIAGVSVGVGTQNDFIVISLDTAGNERWVYRYDGPASNKDEARSVVCGVDGNIYAAGKRGNTNGAVEFTVISLDPAGNERWVYADSCPFGYDNRAESVIVGSDGDVYVAGSSGNFDFTVVSLDAALGGLNWKYQRATPAGFHDYAPSIVQGPDGNLYVAGEVSYYITGGNFTVLSLDTSGSLRWSHMQHGPIIPDSSRALSVDVGSDGTLYACGYISTADEDLDIVAVNLQTSGHLNWQYRRSGSSHVRDRASNMDFGPEGNVYLAGVAVETGTGADFTVIGLGTGDTVSALLNCSPPAGALPLNVGLDVCLTNKSSSQKRRLAAQIDFTSASGFYYPDWRSGWSNVKPGGAYQVRWTVSLPALDSLAGDNVFSLNARDVTPPPYNHAPLPPSGGAAASSCTVTGMAP